MGIVEKSYSNVFKHILRALNPIKKKIINTDCRVHKSINYSAINILKNDGKIDTHDFMLKHIKDINLGAVWADQDFKSTTHFYNPYTKKGLYGHKNAYEMAMLYYAKALKNISLGNIHGAMFYFGAVCHLIQDMTVPQHVNIKLFEKHRQFEQWIRKTYRHQGIFKAHEGGIYLDTIPKYMNYNSKIAIETYNKNASIENTEIRFHKITLEVLVLAQKSTAGVMDLFYNHIQNINLRDENINMAKQCELSLKKD